MRTVEIILDRETSEIFLTGEQQKQENYIFRQENSRNRRLKLGIYETGEQEEQEIKIGNKF